MCGIVGAREGWLRARGLEPTAAMDAAVEALRWRGADRQAHQRAGEWRLGCARLTISAGEGQPVRRGALGTTAVLNGAITNARDLWRELEPGSEHADPLPNDAALPGLLVGHRRAQRLDDLRGHHAYAVVDERTDELFLGQDRYGERPLSCVLARRHGRWQLVAFASTPAALRAFGVVPRPGPDAVAQWFRYGWGEAAACDLEADLRVCELPERGVAYVSRAAGERWVERARPADASGSPAARASTSRAAESLTALLRASVQRCLDTPSTAGLCLSGGVDSSCLALTLGALQRVVPAYQFAARGGATDERRAAAAVAATAGLPLRRVDGGPEVLDALPRLTQLYGQPLGDPSVLAAHAVAAAARADGVRVLLGGEGADELLLGYRRYRALRRLQRVPRPARLGRVVRRLLPWSMSAAARSARTACARNPARALLAVTPPAFGRAVLSEELGGARCWQDAEPLPAGPTTLAEQGRADDLARYLPRDLLPKLDVALLAAGVEGRCPYLEAGVEAFGASLDALGKRPLRDAFAEQLPKEVLRLPKRGFSLPLDAWFRGDLEALDVLAEARTRGRPHLRRGGVAAAVDRHRRGAADLGHGLYLLYAYELHLREQESADR